MVTGVQTCALPISEAVIEMSNGYKAVDYDLLGIEMVEV
jgi:hypothetical protein